MERAPAVIARFMDAAARRDYDDLAACFAEDATVSDEERTHFGRSEIRRWQEDTRAQWDYTVTIAGGEPAGQNEYLVAVRLEGNFPGGEADLNYRFTMHGGLIGRLESSSAARSRSAFSAHASRSQSDRASSTASFSGTLSKKGALCFDSGRSLPDQVSPTVCQAAMLRMGATIKSLVVSADRWKAPIERWLFHRRVSTRSIVRAASLLSPEVTWL